MPQEIKAIRLPLPLRFGSVNCYLLKADGDCMLIDTGHGKPFPMELMP